jgi:hypothetical protein
MITTHKLDLALYAQGWVEGELEYQVKVAEASGDLGKIETANQNLGQFRIVSLTLDEVVKQLRAIEDKWIKMESAFRD